MRTAADKQREAKEDAAGPDLPTVAAAVEARLLAEYSHDPSAKALLHLECARYRATPIEREPLLSQAANALRAAGAAELCLSEACAPSPLGRPRPAAAPPAPQLIYRTASEVCLRPRPFAPIKKPGTVEAPRVFSYAVFGKAAGASGVSVSLNNVDFRGCGEKRPLHSGEDDYDPLKGAIVLRNLPPGGLCVFAVAAYDKDGGLIGSVGATSAPVAAALPLPQLHLWTVLSLRAAQLGCEDVALAAAAEVEATLVARSPSQAMWEASPLGRLRIVPPLVARSAAAELRAACQALLLSVSLRAPTPDGVRGGGPAPVRPPKAPQVETLVLAKLQLLALQLALAADDAPLAASTVQGLFNLIAPLLRLRQASAFLLQPLCAVLRALQMLDRERLVAIRRAPQLLVCTTFGLTKLSQECGLGPLADFVAQTDVCTFAQSLATQYASQAETWADAGMRGAVQASRVETDADALMASMLREYVASDLGLTAPAANNPAPAPDNVDIGLVVWGSLRDAAEAAWEQVEAFAGHPRQLEFAVRVCGEMLRGKQNAETAATVRRLLGKILEATKSLSRIKTRAEASSPPPTADAVADKSGKDKVRRVHLDVPSPPVNSFRSPSNSLPPHNTSKRAGGGGGRWHGLPTYYSGHGTCSQPTCTPPGHTVPTRLAIPKLRRANRPRGRRPRPKRPK